MGIKAAQGQPFEVAVEQHGGSGYLWQVETVPPAIRALDDATAPPAQGDPPGTPQRRAFRFVADQAGDFEVVLALKRPWEGEPIERRTIRVRVDPPA